MTKKKRKMADPRAFISFDFDSNKNEKELFAGQAKNSKTPFNIQDWSSKTELPQWKWEQIIEEKVSKCSLMIVLVGRSSYWASGIKKEISFAKKHNMPLFGVYVDNANSNTELPSGLTKGRTISWDWDKYFSS